MKKGKQKVLVVDDERGVRDFVAEVMQEAGCDVALAGNVDEARAAYLSHRPDRIFLDLQLQGSDGVEFLRFLASEKSAAEIILFSGMDKKTLMTAERLGKDHGLKMGHAMAKPLTIEALEHALKAAFDQNEQISKDELIAALAEDQMTVFFQPQLRQKKDGYWHMHRVEALVRWNHPQRGLLTPDKFIALTEEYGLVSLLTDFVLQKSLEHMKSWEKDGVTLSAAINLSGKMMSDLTLPDRIESQVRRFGLTPTRIMLELTETAVMDDVIGAEEILARLRLKGFDLSLDDFGTGYSSLVQLYRLPFSELKIDRSFVSEVAGDDEAQVIVRSLVDLAHNLGLVACAEGVENKKTFEFLESLGCVAMQGYYFSKPIPATEVVAMVQRWENQQRRVTLRA